MDATTQTYLMNSATGSVATAEDWADDGYTEENANLIEVKQQTDGSWEFASRSVGRPATLSNGRKVNTYLDASSIATAIKLGNGNVSEGIRLALAYFADV